MRYPDEPVVLFHKIDFALPEKTFISLLDKIRKPKQEKIKRYKFREDALRSLFGELLFKYALKKSYNINYDKEIIIEDEYGKPHLNNRDIYFNISHSGDWTAVVCFTSSAGIDIEKIENPPYEIMPKNFTQTECEQIENDDEMIKTIQFYTMWTLKESYIKMLGQGLSIALDSFSISMKDKNNIEITDKNRATNNVCFKSFYPDSNHILSVCISSFCKEIYPQLTSLNELVSNENYQ